MRVLGGTVGVVNGYAHGEFTSSTVAADVHYRMDPIIFNEHWQHASTYPLYKHQYNIISKALSNNLLLWVLRHVLWFSVDFLRFSLV
jgi:hypothetical protein